MSIHEESRKTYGPWAHPSWDRCVADSLLQTVPAKFGRSKSNGAVRSDMGVNNSTTGPFLWVRDAKNDLLLTNSQFTLKI